MMNEKELLELTDFIEKYSKRAIRVTVVYALIAVALAVSVILGIILLLRMVMT